MYDFPKVHVKGGGYIFFRKSDFSGVETRFREKSVYGYNVMMKNRVYTKIRLVGKTVFQYGLRIMLNNQKY